MSVTVEEIHPLVPDRPRATFFVPPLPDIDPLPPDDRCSPCLNNEHDKCQEGYVVKRGESGKKYCYCCKKPMKS